MRGDDRSRAFSALGAVALLLVSGGCSTGAAAGRKQAAEGDGGGAKGSAPASLFPICVGARFGFIDQSGAVVVPPKLGMIDETIGELTKVWVVLPVPPGEEQPGLPPPARAGFVDTRGRFAVEPAYEDAHPFSDGLAAVKREGTWGYVDGCDGGADDVDISIYAHGIGGAGGSMVKVSDSSGTHLTYDLSTADLPRTTQCFILEVTVHNGDPSCSSSDTSSERVLLERSK